MPAVPPAVVAAATALAVAGLLLLLTRTLFTDGHRLTADFDNDSWYIQMQVHWLREQHIPSLFLTASVVAFYPAFAFYGGTLFVFTSLIALLTGSADLAQCIVYTLALAAAYGGWLWLARLAGVRSWPAHAAAILYVTAPYVLTNIYSRQDLAELVATAVIPMLVASTLSILRADRLRPGPAAALAAATIALGGSHNLTLLWSVTIIGITVAIIAICVPQARGLVTRRALLRVLAVAAPAMAVNAWYLLPDLAYHSQTAIAGRIDEWKALFEAPSPEADLGSLLAVRRPDIRTGAGYAIPVLGVGWAIIAGLSARRRRRSGWGRMLVLLLVVTAVLVVIMSWPSLLLVLPDPWLMSQGVGRLNTYAIFSVCGAVIAGLALAQRRPAWLILLLVPILALSCVGAVGQIRNATFSDDGPASLDAHGTFSLGDFADAHLRAVPNATDMPIVLFGRADVHDDQIATTVAGSPGDLLRTNLMTPPGLLDIQGAHVIGRWWANPLQSGWQRRWYLVLRIDDDAAAGQAQIVVREARSLPIVAGKLISLLGLLGLLAVAVSISRPTLLRPRARRRRPRS